MLFYVDFVAKALYYKHIFSKDGPDLRLSDGTGSSRLKQRMCCRV